MRFFPTPLLVLSVLILNSFGAIAQNPMLPTLQQIVDRGEIVVAMIDGDLPPMIMTDKKGNLSGFDVSLAKLIGRELGTKVKFLRVPTFDDVVAHVSEKQADIGISLLSRNTDRARYVRFSQPYIDQGKTLLINRVRGMQFRRACPTLDQLRQLIKRDEQIGVINGSSYESDLQQAVKGTKLKRFETTDDMMAAVFAGKVIGSIQGEVTARYFLHTNPYANIRLSLCEYKGRTDHIGIAVRPDALDLVEWLNVLLDEFNLHFDAEVLLEKDPLRILP